MKSLARSLVVAMGVLGMLALLAACTGNKDNTPTAGSTTGPGTATATAGSQPSGELPKPDNAVGEITIAEVVSPDLSGDPAVQSGGRYEGILESLFTTTGSGTTVDNSTPMLAKSWTLAPDQSSVTIQLQQGVQFQRGYGEMTAEDVAWTLNRINPAINPTSIATSAANFAALFGDNPIEVVDKYTIKGTFAHYDVRLTSYLLNQYGQTPAVAVPKAEFDQKGQQYMSANLVGTGPFQVKEYQQGVKVVVEKIPDKHWRKDAAIDTFTVLAVAEENTRVSMLQTGQVDASFIDPKDVSRVKDMGFTWIPNGNSTQEGVFFTGNLWEATNAITGQPIDIAGSGVFARDIQWVGNPWTTDDSNNPEGIDDMEQARLVRTALASSVDRNTIVSQILNGVGEPNYVNYFSISDSHWQSKWEYPYDADAAGKLLDQAGYPVPANGGNRFEMALFVGPELGGGEGPAGEIGDAIAGYWQKIGIKVEVLKYAYAVYRPGLVSRGTVVPFLTSCDEGQDAWPWDWPHGQEMTTLSRGGFSCGFESPEILDIYSQTAKEADSAKRIDLNNQLADYLYHWALDPGYVSVPSGRFVNSNSIKSWVMDPGLTGSYNSPENIVPAAR